MIKRVLKKFRPGVPDDYADPNRNLEDSTSYKDADLITSKVESSALHAPVIDIDYPIMVIPSSTPGHYHLYIEKAILWEDYAYLLMVLAKIGLIEEGFAQASIFREYSAVRLPWVKKDVVPQPVNLKCALCQTIIKPESLITYSREYGFAHFDCSITPNNPGVPF